MRADLYEIVIVSKLNTVYSQTLKHKRKPAAQYMKLFLVFTV